jgi:RNA polymerase sigma-70 factor (ECF subfamily)
MEIYGLIAQGDEEAMTAVFRQYYPRLLNFAQSLIHNEQESEDLAMKAMSTLWEHATNQSGAIDNIQSWLFTIVRHGCYDYLKHEKIKSTKQKDIIGEETENAIEAKLIQEDIIEKIYQEIMNLPDRCKEIAELTYINGLSTSEIAQQLNITESTVRSQKARAKELLKTALIRNNLTALLIFL